MLDKTARLLHGLLGRCCGITLDELDRLAVDPACRVDLVHGKFRRLEERLTEVREVSGKWEERPDAQRPRVILRVGARTQEGRKQRDDQDQRSDDSPLR